MAHMPAPVRRGPVWTYEDFNLSIHTLPIELLDHIMDLCAYHYLQGGTGRYCNLTQTHPTLHHCARVSRTFRAAAQRALSARLEFSSQRRTFLVYHWFSQPDFIRTRHPPTRLFVEDMDVFSVALAGISTVPTIRTLVLTGYAAIHWNLIAHPSLAAVESLTIECTDDPVNDNNSAWEGEPPRIPFSLQKLELGHVSRSGGAPMSATLVTALFLASPDLTTLALVSKGGGVWDIEPGHLDAFFAVFPLVSAKLKRLDLDSTAPSRELFPDLHLCTSIEHLTIRLDLLNQQSTKLAEDFFDALPPANVVRRLEINPLDPCGRTGDGYGLAVLSDAYCYQQHRTILPLLEEIVVLHVNPVEIALAGEMRELVRFGAQTGVAILDCTHSQIVPGFRPDPPPPPPPPAPAPPTGAYGVVVRNVLPSFGVSEASAKRMISSFRSDLESSYAGKAVNLGIAVALYFSGYPDY